MFILDVLSRTHTCTRTNMYTTVLARTPGHEVGVGGGGGTAAGVKKASYAVYIQYSTVSVLLTVLVLLPKPN